MSESPNKDEHVGRGGERADTDADDLTSPDGTEVPLEEQPSAEAAELRLIDALLWSMSDQAALDRSTRIRRVMEAIEDRPDVPDARTRPRGWQSAVAVAACLMVACTLLWLQFSRESRAADVLLEVGRVSSEKVDRVYSFRRVVSTSDEANQHQGRLYLRGCDGFVITCDDVVLGCNTDQFWFVPPAGPVILAEDFAWMVGRSEHEQLEIELLNVLAIDSRGLPMVQLSSAVELMRHDYDVVLDVDVLHGERVDVLVGNLRGEIRGLPDTIRLWSGRDSWIIQRAELEWKRPHEKSSANVVILELTAEGGVGADWYDHEAHHPPDRPLHRISSGS